MTERLPDKVRGTLAKRVYRMQHYLWFELRDFWSEYPEDARQRIRDLGWEPPRPPIDEHQQRSSPTTPAKTSSTCTASGSPSSTVSSQMSQIPRFPGSRVGSRFQEPERSRLSGTASVVRTSILCGFQRIHHPGQDRRLLRSALPALAAAVRGALVPRAVTLGSWARSSRRRCTMLCAADGRAPPAAIRPDPPIPGEPIDEGWDDPPYDFLRDHYSMHVNPIYWKFYGWVIDRVEDWKVANGVFGRDFWKATWIGKMPPDHRARRPMSSDSVSGPPLLAALDDPRSPQRTSRKWSRWSTSSRKPWQENDTSNPSQELSKRWPAGGTGSTTGSGTRCATAGCRIQRSTRRFVTLGGSRLGRHSTSAAGRSSTTTPAKTSCTCTVGCSWMRPQSSTG